jgi:choice-of-anchor C domain-containing protein
MKMKNRIVWGGAALLLFSFLPVSQLAAQPLLTNGTFEDAPCNFPLTNVPAGSSAITGWQIIGRDIDAYCGGYWTVPEGTHAVDLNGDHGSASIAQSFPTDIGQKYQVRFDFSGNPDGVNAKTVTMRVTAASNSAEFSFDTTGKSPSNMGWVEQAFTFTATSTTTTLTFDSLYDNCCTGPAIDNVRVNPILPLTFDRKTSADFSGTCTVNNTPTPVTVKSLSTARGSGPVEIQPLTGNFFLATFSGVLQGQDSFTVNLGNNSASVTAPTTGTFNGTFNTQTQQFPILLSTSTSPPVSLTVGNTTITSFTYGQLTQPPIVNSVTYSNNSAFPFPGSSVFFDVTLNRTLVLGGLNCTLTGSTSSGVTQRLTRKLPIDIKPGSAPNPINPGSNGVIPVAILTTTSFDATTVDPVTVLFGRTGLEAPATHSAVEDVNGDGVADLMLQFNTQKTGIKCGDTSASLTGATFTGEGISGSDSLVTTGCK